MNADVTVSLRLHPDAPHPVLVVKGTEKQCLRLIGEEAPALIERVLNAGARFQAEQPDEPS